MHEATEVVAIFWAFKGPIMSVFQPYFTAYPNLMIPFSPPFAPSAPPPSPHLVFSIFLWPHCCSLLHLFTRSLATARTYVPRAPTVRKSITSSRHCLNFQLTTLRSVSPDTSITADRIRRELSPSTLNTADTLRTQRHTTEMKYSNRVLKAVLLHVLYKQWVDGMGRRLWLNSAGLNFVSSCRQAKFEEPDDFSQKLLQP